MSITAIVTKGAQRTNDSAVFDVTLPDGQTAGIWAGKNTDMNAFLEIHQGDTVELQPGNKPGKYFFKKKVSSGSIPVQNGSHVTTSNPGRYEPSKQEIADYIKAKSGHYFYAYKCLDELFNGEDGMLVTEETLRQAAATVLISLDRNLY